MKDLIPMYWGAAAAGKKGDKNRADSSSPPQGQVLRDDGHIWFYKEVNQNSIADLVCNLHKMAVERQVQALQLGLSAPAPLHLHIHSYGGSVFAGFAAVDAILRCPVPVHTHIEGGAASAATLFSVAGAHRTIGRHSFVLIHQLSSMFWGKYEEFKDEMQNNDLIMGRIRQLYEGRTNISAVQLGDILKRDLWFDANTALEAGLVDEIVG